MAQSSPVTGGVTAVLASQYNLLRDDVLSSTVGHRHTGGTAEGRIIQPAGLENRTRVFLVPAVGRDTDGGQGLEGVQAPDAVTTAILGRFALPMDYVDGGTVSIKAVVYSDVATGDIRCRNRGAYFACGQTPVTMGPPAVTETISNDETFYCVAEMTSIAINAGDMIVLDFFRYGGSAPDTLAGTIEVPGWRIEYLADS